MKLSYVICVINKHPIYEANVCNEYIILLYNQI